MLRKLREPVNSLTHWGATILALAGLIALLIVGWGRPAKIISLVIYGLSLIFLFSASATYHMVRVKDKALEIFRKIDHAAIYFLIAGTYTPFCINAFSGFWKWGLLSLIWSLAIIGILVKVFYIRAPRWLNAGIYLVEPAAGAYVPQGKRFDMTDLIDALVRDGKRVVGFPISEYWLDIGKPADYEQAQLDAKSGVLSE